MTETTAPRAQCHPAPSQAPLVVQLVILGRALSYLMDRRLSRHGHNLTQASIIVALTRHPGLTAQDLARPAWIEPSSVTRALQVLERRGLVERKAHPTDGRAMMLSLSERGKSEAQLIFGLMKAANASLEDGLDPEDVEAIRHALPGWFERAAAVWDRDDVDEGAQPTP